ncbi:MAG TPA: hypothetical protein VMU24_09500, partial [Candidatus Acidoferrales bacterium]|nr:hypothetical protein [Candidatus Acidoferrales bacterium]
MPVPLEHTSARELEFERLREIIGAYCGSPLGRQRVAALTPTTDREWLERQQQLTTELRSFLRAGFRFEFAGLAYPGDLLAKSRIHGATLESEELRSILTLVDRASEWREIVLHPSAQMKEPWPAIEELS